MTKAETSPALYEAERFTSVLQKISGCLNRVVEVICALLLGLMVLIVWLGVVDRYFVGSNITWTEEFSRYLMIWAALLSVPCGARRREHIGFNLLVDKLPAKIQYLLSVLVDLISVLFFLYLTIYGTQMTIDGAHQYATIFGMTMVIPFASVPVSALLTAIQIILTSPFLLGNQTLLTKEIGK